MPKSLRLAVLAALFVALSAVSSLAQKAAPKAPAGAAALDSLHQRIDQAAEKSLTKLVAWRRDLHEHPELGNREVRTSKIVADHLQGARPRRPDGRRQDRRGGRPQGGQARPVVALRSDMDALPVVEETGLPFASTVRTEYNGRQVGVMHACGHDYHMAILMGTAEVLTSLKADLAGTVVFLFQPAEEGRAAGEEGGAELMIKDGALDNPKVEAIFGLHVFPKALRAIEFRPRGIMAAGDTINVVVHGKGTHGAMPAAGIDPIVVAAQIVLGFQTIVSRQVDLTTAPAVITIWSHRGRKPVEHHLRHGADDRYDPNLRPGDAGADHGPREADGREDRGLGGCDR